MPDTFQYGDAVVRVKRETVGDRLKAEVIESKMATAHPDTLYWAIRQFARFCVNCHVESGTLPFAIPSAAADSNVIAKAFDDWMDCDADLFDNWSSANGDVNLPKA